MLRVCIDGPALWHGASFESLEIGRKREDPSGAEYSLEKGVETGVKLCRTSLAGRDFWWDQRWMQKRRVHNRMQKQVGPWSERKEAQDLH